MMKYGNFIEVYNNDQMNALLILRPLFACSGLGEVSLGDVGILSPGKMILSLL